MLGAVVLILSAGCSESDEGQDSGAASSSAVEDGDDEGCAGLDDCEAEGESGEGAEDTGSGESGECQPGAEDCPPACDPNECLVESRGECVPVCREGQVCDGAGTCEADGRREEPRLPPPQFTRATTQCLWQAWPGAAPETGIDCTQWAGAGMFGNAFPESTSSRQFFLDPGHYLALEFDTGDYVGERSGRISVAEAQFGAPETFGGGQLITSISRYPGDFDGDAIVAESEDACFRVGGVPVSWSTTDYAGSIWPANSMCALEPNTVYYFNIVFSDSPAGTAPADLVWSCSGSEDKRCGRLFQVSEF